MAGDEYHYSGAVIALGVFVIRAYLSRRMVRGWWTLYDCPPLAVKSSVYGLFGTDWVSYSPWEVDRGGVSSLCQGYYWTAVEVQLEPPSASASHTGLRRG